MSFSSAALPASPSLTCYLKYILFHAKSWVTTQGHCLHSLFALSHSSHFPLFILEALHCIITSDYVYSVECKYPVCLWLLVCAIIFQTWWEFDSALLHPIWHPFCPECACHRTLFCVNIECLVPRRIYDVFIMGLMTTQATRFSYPGQQVLRSRTVRSDTDVTWLDG